MELSLNQPVPVREEQKKEKSCWTDKTYDICNQVGLWVNIVACSALGIARSCANVQSMNNGQVNKMTLNAVFGLYMTESALIVISSAFMAEALRIFARYLNQNKGFLVNQKTMCLHLSILTMVSCIHTLCTIFFQVARVAYFKSIGTD